MQIDINETGQIRLKEVFNPIELVSTDGESITVCMRDGGFEIGVEDASVNFPDKTRHFTWYRIKNGGIERISAFLQKKIDRDIESTSS